MGRSSIRRSPPSQNGAGSISPPPSPTPSISFPLGGKNIRGDSIEYYNKKGIGSPQVIEDVNKLTGELLEATNLSEFEFVLFAHEVLVGKHLNLTPVKERLFMDYPGEVKSLGAWGGDSVLATSKSSYSEVAKYFSSKGYDTCIPYSKVIFDHTLTSPHIHILPANTGRKFTVNNIVRWESPSNIAIVKYWGKKGIQIPANPSVSLTLSKCKTITEVEWKEKKETDSPSFEYLFEGKKNYSFEEKISHYLVKLLPDHPFLEGYHLCIRSQNTFPHSAGLASSASSMSALALCLVSLEEELGLQEKGRKDFLQRASNLGRIGSGSACRSLFPHAALWENGERAKR